MDVNYFPRLPPGLRRLQQSAFPPTSRGVSLVELVVVIGILGIILALATPSFASLLQGNRLSTSLNTLASSLQYARSEAIKRSTNIVICRGQVDTGCSSQRSWSDGWLTFVDADSNRTWSAGETALWTQGQLPTGIELHYAAFPSSTYVVFYPEGSASSNGTFTFCDTHGEAAAKALILAKSGRLRLATKTSDGTPLSCP